MKQISFRENMIDLIRKNLKTVTVRPMKPQPVFGSGTLPECPYKVGDVLAVREDQDIQLLVTGITAAWLHEIKARHMGREGLCPCLDASCECKDGDRGDLNCGRCQLLGALVRRFFSLWFAIYENTEYKAENRPAVWVIEFKKLTGKDQ